GKPQFFKWSKFTPFDDMYKGGQRGAISDFLNVPDSVSGYLEGVAPGMGNIGLDLTLQLINNQSNFTGKQIYDPNAPINEILVDQFNFLAPAFAPVVGTPLRDLSNTATDSDIPAILL